MQTKKITTTGLAILAIVTAISLITASSSGGLVTSAFALKKGMSDKKGTSSSGKSGSSISTSSTGGTSKGSKSKFIKCVTAISGSPAKAQVDKCWDQVFGGGSGLTLGGSFGGTSNSGFTLGSSSSTSSKSSSGSSGHSSGSPSGTSA
jgi:G:T/U-mismatch repair DNA glycosylase